MAPFPHRFVLRQSAIAPDPLLGHAFRPGLDMPVPHEASVYRLRTNRDGFRDDRAHGPKREGVPKIVVFGDSFSAGDGVENHARWSDQLAARFGADVLNLAVPGGAPDHNVLLVEQAWQHRDADLVIWAVAVQTLARIQLSERWVIGAEGVPVKMARPHFRLEEGVLVLHWDPEHAAPSVPRSLPVPPLESDLVRISRGVARRTKNSAARFLRRNVMPLGEPDYAGGDSESWPLMRALAERFVAQCNAPVALVPLPHKAHLTGEMAPSFQGRFAALAREIPGLTALDVTSPLLRAPASNRRSFSFAIDGHYSASGHTAVAAALGDALVHAGLIPAAAVPADRRPQTRTAPPSPRAPFELVLGWTPDASWAEIRDVQSGSVVARHDESAFAAGLGYAGAVPVTAAVACLESAKANSVDLGRIVLECPYDVRGDAGPLGSDAWLRWTAPWVRWNGAAARDIRALLSYDGPVEHRVGTEPYPEDGPASAHSGHTEEDAWLHARLLAIRRHTGSTRRARAFTRLTRAWERTTRRARASALPIPL